MNISRSVFAWHGAKVVMVGKLKFRQPKKDVHINTEHPLQLDEIIDKIPLDQVLYEVQQVLTSPLVSMDWAV